MAANSGVPAKTIFNFVAVMGEFYFGMICFARAIGTEAKYVSCSYKETGTDGMKYREG